jgi:hypothetical protein
MKSKEKTNTDISIGGNLDGNVIIGNGNRIDVSSGNATEKIASELALKRLREELEILYDDSWEFIVNDVLQDDPSFWKMVTGKYNPYGLWFYNTVVTFPNFKINGEKVKNTANGQEISEIIWKMSPQEIQLVLDYLPSRWNGKSLEGVKKFGENILEYSKKIEKCRAELKHHEEIVKR